MSLRMAEQFVRTLRGEAPPAEVLGTLRGQLEEIIAQGEQQS